MEETPVRVPPLNAATPATVDVRAAKDGGVCVSVRVPTYSGGIVFTVDVERDRGGDWVVSLPWPYALTDEPVRLPSGVEVANGIAYLAAPDVPTTPAWLEAGR